MEVWSFFSGAMGLDLGLQQIGLEATVVVEKDKWCCQTIQTNKPDLLVIEDDIRNLNKAKIRERRDFFDDVFLITGGPPCQSFSTGGKRAALSDPRGNLIYEFFRLVNEVQPKFFLFENVANLTTAALRHRKIKDRPGKHWNLKQYQSGRINGTDDALPLAADEMSGSAIQHLLTDIKQLNYSITLGVLDAADYGTAQHRLRFILLGARDGVALPLPSPKYSNKQDHLPPLRTVRNAIVDLRLAPGPHSSYTPEMARYFDLVPEGGNWRDLPKSIQAEALGGAYNSGGGKTGFFRRLSWDKPAPTIIGRANRKGSAICHPEFTRPLSVRECARIQGFPDTWEFCGSMSQQYLQIGNAVPVELGKALGESIIQGAKTLEPSSLPKIEIENSIEIMLDKAVTRLRASARNKKSKQSEQTTLQPRLF